MANRAVLLALLLVGLAIGISGGVEQAGLGRSIYLVREASAHVGGDPASWLREARQGLDTCFDLTTASMYLGVAVVLLSVAGMYVQDRHRRRDGRPE